MEIIMIIILTFIPILVLIVLLVFGILSARNYVKHYNIEDLYKAKACFALFLLLALALTLLVLAFIL